MNKSIDGSAVEQAAILARLTLSEEEKILFESQLISIVRYIEELNRVDTTGVEPTSHAVDGVTNVFRQDRLIGSLERRDVLANSPVDDEVFFKVPKVLK